jgi:putative restriction endonuclease
MACFLALDVLRAQFGDELPYNGGLDRKFAFRGQRIPFLTYQKGIYRAAVQRGPAALAIQTSAKAPYGDEATDDGFLYAYRAGAIDQPDNVHFARLTRSACHSSTADRMVRVAPGRMVGPMDEREPILIDSSVERRYATHQIKVRLHQRRFRWLVIPAYREQCAICRLKEPRLLDAAHIVGDPEPTGTPEIRNGLSLCSIHHRAFDQDSLASRPTAGFTFRSGCSTTRTGRCSTS